jgi:predicted transcriptional regulator
LRGRNSQSWLSDVEFGSVFDMTKEAIDALLEGVRSWPPEDQEELAEFAREIEARRTGVYVMDDEERAAVRAGLEQARRGEFVSDDEMDAFWKKYGVL